MKTVKILSLLVVCALFFTGCTGAQPDGEEPEQTPPASEDVQVLQTAAPVPQNEDELFKKWTELGVVTGIDGGYDPDGEVTLAQLAAFVRRIGGFNADYSAVESELEPEQWYYDDLMTLSALGVLDGAEDIAPNDALSRQQAIALVSRCFQYDVEAPAETSYSDNAAISPWASGACRAMDDAGFLRMFGYELSPEKPITRAELLWIFDAMINDMTGASEVVSGAYPAGVVIAGDGVVIENADISGDVYITGTARDVSISGSVIRGTVYVGCAGAGGPYALSVSGSKLSALVAAAPGELKLDCQLSDAVLDNASVNMELGSTAVLGRLRCAAPAAVTGTGMICSASVESGAEGTSFEVMPAELVDIPNRHYTGVDPVEGFASIGGKTYYIGEGGSIATGFIRLENGSEYCFDENGVMCTGLCMVDGQGYYFDAHGSMLTGWYESGGAVRFFGSDGIMYRGYVDIDGEHYYFDDDGCLCSGVTEIGGEKYLLSETGEFLTGLCDLEGERYLAGEDSVIKRGLQEYDGELYYFDPDTGAMLRDTTVDDYVIGSDGRIEQSGDTAISTGSESLDADLDEIVAELTNEDMSLDDKMYAVYKWTATAVKYRTTPIDLSNGFTQELVIEHLQNTLDTRRGACEHFAMVTAGLFNRLGVETILIEGTRYSTYYGTWDDHTWVLAKVDGKWYHFDTLYEYQHVGTDRGCYMKTDEQFSGHHRWDAEKYPACEG